MARIESWFKQDLTKPVQVQCVNGNLFSQDNQGNLFGVSVFDNGQPAVLSGTVSAHIIRPDNSTLAVSGTYSGNKCSVILPSAAYAVPGNETLVMKLTSDGVVTTLLAVVFTVYRSSTDVIVDPGTIMPSIETLIQNINSAVASVPADLTNLWTTFAPAYSTSATYSIGSYVTYNGHLYRCISAISTAEAWTAGHWTAVNLGNELSNLNSALSAIKVYPIVNPNSVSFEDNKLTITANGGIIFIDEKGGYSHLNPGEYTFSNGYAYVISTTENSYTPVDFSVKKNNDTLYLYAQEFHNIMSNHTVFAICVGTNVYSLHGILENLAQSEKFSDVNDALAGIYNKDIHIFQTSGNAVFTPTGTGTTGYWTLSNLGCIVFDRNGGYRNVSAQDWVLNSGEFLVLSTTQNSYTKPDFNTKGTGQTLYLYKISQYRIKPEYHIVAFTWALKLYSLDNFLGETLINNAVNSVVQHVGNAYAVVNRASLFYSNLTLKSTANNGITFFDEKGGYSFLAPGTYSFINNRAYVLSKSSSSLDPVDFSKKQSGTLLYLYETLYSNLQTGYEVFAICFGGNVYSYQNILDVETIKTSLDENVLSDNGRKEQLGILPRESFEKSPIGDTYDTFEKLRDKNGDVTIVHLGDSISTNQYTSAYSDVEYRPCRMDEKCLPALVEELIRWRGQQYRRADAMTEQGGSTPMFTETKDSASNTYYDAAWDWQFDPASNNNYRVWTRILTGTNCSVAFTIPAGTREAAFIYRTDYLCANNATVTISTGSGKVKAKLLGESTLTEANGYTFSMKETDEVLTWNFTDSTGTSRSQQYRVSRAQKRLVFSIEDISQDITITITNSGSGRLNYWGVEWSKYNGMIRYINFARGGHNMASLKCFEGRDVDEIKPDLIVFQCPIINEGAMSVVSANTPNTPAAFAQRFSTRIAELKAKTYTPEILPYVLYIGTQANIVNQTTGEYQCSVITGYGVVDTYQYIGALHEAMVSANNGVFVDLFFDFDQIAYKLAELGDGNVYTSAIAGSGYTGDTLTYDNVHLNNYGSLVAYRLLKKWFSY